MAKSKEQKVPTNLEIHLTKKTRDELDEAVAEVVAEVVAEGFRLEKRFQLRDKYWYAHLVTKGNK